MEHVPETAQLPSSGSCRKRELFVKRCLDVIISAAALALLSPLLLAVAALIKMSSPGPVFYRGVRAGLNGRTFRIFKFRTMVMNAESMGGPTTATNDSRVTPIGRVLRRTKFDELPQFINVLTGDMSLVGPRPEVVEYTARYQGEEKLILSVRPGITDYASITFADLDDRVGSEDADEYFQKHILPEKNRLRVLYIKNWSLKNDFKILASTALRVLKRSIDR